MAVVPGLLRRGAEVVGPAIGELLGGIVEARVLLIGHQVVVDGRFEEVARGVAFVIAAMRRVPMRELAALDDAAASALPIERERGLQVAIGLLRREDDWNPLIERGAELLVRVDDFLI